MQLELDRQVFIVWSNQGVLVLSPGWDTSPSHGYPPAFHYTSLTICQYPCMLLGRQRQCDIIWLNDSIFGFLQLSHDYQSFTRHVWFSSVTYFPPLFLKCTCVLHDIRYQCSLYQASTVSSTNDGGTHTLLVWIQGKMHFSFWKVFQQVTNFNSVVLRFLMTWMV